MVAYDRVAQKKENIQNYLMTKVVSNKHVNIFLFWSSPAAKQQLSITTFDRKNGLEGNPTRFIRLCV